MDELKIAINSAFMKRIITTVISKVIEKKLGYKIDIQINEIKADVTGGVVKFHLDIGGQTTTDELSKLLKSKDII